MRFWGILRGAWNPCWLGRPILWSNEVLWLSAEAYPLSRVTAA
jgi:hypothetical protein